MQHNDPQYFLTPKAWDYLDNPPRGGCAPWVRASWQAGDDLAEREIVPTGSTFDTPPRFETTARDWPPRFRIAPHRRAADSLSPAA